jgi:hypothetical protein
VSRTEESRRQDSLFWAALAGEREQDPAPVTIDVQELAPERESSPSGSPVATSDALGELAAGSGGKAKLVIAGSLAVLALVGLLAWRGGGEGAAPSRPLPERGPVYAPVVDTRANIRPLRSAELARTKVREAAAIIESRYSATVPLVTIARSLEKELEVPVAAGQGPPGTIVLSKEEDGDIVVAVSLTDGSPPKVAVARLRDGG